MDTPRARTAGRTIPWVVVVMCAIAVGMPPSALLPLLLGIGLERSPSVAERKGDGVTSAAPRNQTGGRQAGGRERRATPPRAEAQADRADRELRSYLAEDRKLQDHLRVTRSAADVPFALPLTRAPCA